MVLRGYKRLCALALTLAVVFACFPLSVAADEEGVDLKLDEDLPMAAPVISMTDSLPAKSAILMDQQSGRVLHEQNADEQLAPASITKIMTLLLVMEALDEGRIALDDQVTASLNANSMGGSQIWLKEGEVMSVDMLLRAVAIVSANDASVALAEHVSGTEGAFIDQMNKRAAELGMVNTHFYNCTGLDEEGHLTTARDVAICTRELMKHPLITEYSTVWMDNLRGGDTMLVNTNKLVRYYEGATGLKTGTTNIAGSCLSATATRDDLSIIAVVLGSPDSDSRFSAARGLLDYGFSNFVSVTPPSIDELLTPVKVLHGMEDKVQPVFQYPGSVVVEREKQEAIIQEVTLAPDLQAPVAMGQVVGKVEILVDGVLIGSYPLHAAKSIERMTFSNAFGALGRALFKMR